MKQWELFKELILDTGLYRKGFVYNSLLYVIIGVVAQFFANFLLNVELVIFYIPLYLAVILIIALFTKKKFTEKKGNKKAVFNEIQTIPFLAYLLFLTSLLLKAFIRFVPFPDVYPFFPSLAQFVLVLAIAETAFLSSLVLIVMRGQRASIRIRLGLDKNFFDKEKKRWKIKLDRFPRNEKIVKKLDEGKFLLTLFDDGNFNLTILWSCSIMEKVLDEISRSLIIINPEYEQKLKKSDSDYFKPLHKRLKILGYTQSLNPSENIEIDAKKLWTKLRSKIAHHNKKPTYEQTIESIRILINFIKETPEVLNDLMNHAQK